jgi:hypothetical protein
VNGKGGNSFIRSTFIALFTSNGVKTEISRESRPNDFFQHSFFYRTKDWRNSGSELILHKTGVKKKHSLTENDVDVLNARPQ